MLFSSFCAVILGFICFSQGLENYLAKEHVTLEELSSLKRSDGGRTFKLNAFGEEHHFNLKRTVDLLPEDLRVHVHDVDSDGNDVINDWTHKTTNQQQLYSDAEKGTSVMVDDTDGKTKLTGMLTYDVVIEPDVYVYMEGEDELETKREVQVKHVVYKVKRELAETQVSDYVDVEDEADDVTVKRAIPEKVYVPVHVVIDYSYWKKLGSSESKAIQYIKIFYNTVNQLYSTIAWPYVTVSIQGITICKSASACSMVEGARLSGGSSDAVNAKTALDAIAKYAYNKKSDTGESYALMMVMTDYDLCSATSSGSCSRSTAGLAFVGTACSPFRYEKTSKVGIAEDHGAYDGAKTVSHEMGHILGMKHDGDGPASSGAPGARNCNWNDNYIMGLTGFVANQFKWSKCSVDQLRWLATQSKASCLLSPPSRSSYRLENKLPGKVLDLDNQCKVLRGSSSGVGCRLPGVNSGNDALCLGLMCKTSGNGCKSSGAAAEGSYCGPQRYCRSGKCVCDPTAPLPTALPRPASCRGDNKNIRISGKSCVNLLSAADGLKSCEFSSVKQYCCESRVKYCRATPISCDGSDIPTTRKATPPKEIFTAAQKTTLAPFVAPTGINCGKPCKDTPNMRINGKTCSSLLSSSSNKRAYCDNLTIIQHCCSTRYRVCSGYHSITESCDTSCQDNPRMQINGQKCVPFLSTQINRENFCDADITRNNCCATRRKMCASVLG